MILITGASSGLGAALASLYDKDNESLLLCGRHAERLSNVSNALQNRAGLFLGDLSVSTDTERLYNQITKPPKMIIHCAGSGYFGPLEKQTSDNIEQLLKSNVLSSTYVLQQAVKHFKNQPIRVVVVMSTAALQAKAGETTYCAAKWAVKGLVESLRLELKGCAMQLICVYPGGMDTDFWPSSGKKMDTSGFMQAEEAAIMIKQALGQTEHGYVSDITVNRQ